MKNEENKAKQSKAQQSKAKQRMPKRRTGIEKWKTLEKTTQLLLFLLLLLFCVGWVLLLSLQLLPLEESGTARPLFLLPGCSSFCSSVLGDIAASCFFSKAERKEEFRSRIGILI